MLGAGREGELENGNLDRDGSPANLVAGADTQGKKKWKWKSLSSFQLCDPKDYMVHGILPARILEWVAFPFSGGSSQPRD